jgi:hypothetical protein
MILSDQRFSSTGTRIRFSLFQLTNKLFHSFQARIGNMDGIFIAYHNTARLFGFQYVPLDEMEERLFGAAGRGGIIFEKCVAILEEAVSEIVQVFPEQVRHWFLELLCILLNKFRGSLSNVHLKLQRVQT